MPLQDIAALLSRGASEAQREVVALKQQQMNLKLEAGRLSRCDACDVLKHLKTFPDYHAEACIAC